MPLEVPLIDWDLLNWDTKIRKQGNQSENDYKAYWKEITHRPGCLDANGLVNRQVFFCFRNRVPEMFCKQNLDCSTHLLFMKACDLCHTQNDSIIILSQDLNHSCWNVHWWANYVVWLKALKRSAPSCSLHKLWTKCTFQLSQCLIVKKLVPTGGNNYRTISVLETFKEINNHNRSN